MRISDWSSDVCSSDLPRTAPPAVRSVPGSGTETTVSAATIQAAPGSDGRCGRRRAYAGTARTQSRRGDAGERPDRKSVVKGKSVSVRVDLGGRRIIKKKKKQVHKNEGVAENKQ